MAPARARAPKVNVAKAAVASGAAIGLCVAAKCAFQIIKGRFFKQSEKVLVVDEPAAVVPDTVCCLEPEHTAADKQQTDASCPDTIIVDAEGCDDMAEVTADLAKPAETPQRRQTCQQWQCQCQWPLTSCQSLQCRAPCCLMLQPWCSTWPRRP
jgi:hypothetical protein